MEERKIAATEQANEIGSQKIQVPLQVAQINSETDMEIAKLESETKLAIANEDLEHKEDMQEAGRKTDLDKIMLQDSNDARADEMDSLQTGGQEMQEEENESE